MKISLKTEEKLSDASQFFESVLIVVSQALGGKKTDTPTGKPAETEDELEAKLNRIMG